MTIDCAPTIGIEVHAELQTRSKMFCGCRVVDSAQVEPNTAVCPVCAGMPGVLPVANRRAVEYGIRVALALGCEIKPVSIFARKNYFYPDLPKGYQISQYDQPLARNGSLTIRTSAGKRDIRVRRVHLEEDTGKLTHVGPPDPHTLVDLNRAGIPLLEIVSEPDIRSAEEARAYADALRRILVYLGVCSGDMQKGAVRIEPNVSVRPVGSTELGTRTEIKNLNSFRALERASAYEIQRQSELLRQGGRVIQQTMGWDEKREVTFTQRTKEEENDYLYFPEPDLPPLVVGAEWIAEIRVTLPELPAAKFRRFQEQYSLNAYDANVLTAEQPIADYFEAVVKSAPGISPKAAANWVSGELFGLMNQAGVHVARLQVSPQALGELLQIIVQGEINQSTAKTVLAEMFAHGGRAGAIISERGLSQISDGGHIAELVAAVLAENPDQVADYLRGKDTLTNWFFGQVMRAAKGKANPQVVRCELEQQLANPKKSGKR